MEVDVVARLPDRKARFPAKIFGKGKGFFASPKHPVGSVSTAGFSLEEKAIETWSALPTPFGTKVTNVWVYIYTPLHAFNVHHNFSLRPIF